MEMANGNKKSPVVYVRMYMNMRGTHLHTTSVLHNHSKGNVKLFDINVEIRSIRREYSSQEKKSNWVLVKLQPNFRCPSHKEGVECASFPAYMNF